MARRPSRRVGCARPIDGHGAHARPSVGRVAHARRIETVGDAKASALARTRVQGLRRRGGEETTEGERRGEPYDPHS